MALGSRPCMGREWPEGRNRAGKAVFHGSWPVARVVPAMDSSVYVFWGSRRLCTMKGKTNVLPVSWSR